MVRAEDAELVRQARSGEREAFTELVNRYRDVVCGTAYHYLGNFEDAQDAAQEAFIHAYRHLDQLRDPERFAPWLRRTTANLCADLLRRQGSRSLSLDGATDQEIAAGEARAVSSPGAHPEEQIERLATRLVVREALNHLSEKVRLTVTLFYMSGYSHAEISQFLEIPVNTVRSRLQHAKRQLREEMVSMMTQVLNEGRPDPEFARRVVEEAMRHGAEAMQARAQGEAIRHYDEALTALADLEPGAEQQRLRMEALWKKGEASRFPHGSKEAIPLFRQSVALAGELGDHRSEAEKLVGIGTSTNDPQEAVDCYQRALQLYRELDDPRGQAECLMWLGSARLFALDAAEGRRYYEQAQPLLEAAGALDYAAVCRGMLALVAEVGEERFPRLWLWSGGCDVLEQKAGIVKYISQPGSMMTNGNFGGPEPPPGLIITEALYLAGQARTMLDASVPVGGGWSAEAFSYSYRPLQLTATVKSASEHITVPVGSFENCLLIELVTRESDLSDEAPESARELNRKFNCGTRRVWYAPGVGLAQIQVQRLDGTEALIQLREFSRAEASDAYLPLAIGNAWSYGWANVPDEWVTKEAHRVVAHQGERWYLEEYCYQYAVS